MRHYFFNNLNFFNTAKLLQGLVILAILIVSVSASAANLIPSRAATDPDKQLELLQTHKDHLNALDSLIDQTSEITTDDRIVVVTFFASWCPPCLHEFKALNEITNQLDRDKFTVVAVNVFEEFDDNDKVRMEKFLQTTQPEFAVLKGTVQSREMFGNIRRIPTLLVFDRDGNLAFDFVHAQGATKQSVDSEELLGAIRPLL